MQLSQQELDSYFENGFVVIRNLLSSNELEALRQRADDIADGRTKIPEGEVVFGRATGVARRKSDATRPAAPAMAGASMGAAAVPSAGTSVGAPMMAAMSSAAKNAREPEIRLTDRHARRGYQVYPIRTKPIDEAALRAALATDDPWNTVGGINHLCDHDPMFLEFARHPNAVAVLKQLIGPNVKLFFDHLFYKGPYGGHNRFHQDGFFEFSDRSVTCWIALDEVTTENGCLRYIPDSAGYGQFRFDQIADGVTPEMLMQEVLVPLHPGDAVFHDRWTLHATGPNETPKGRRGWAVHYTSAKSRFIYDPTFTATTYTQTPDGRHYRDDELDGNRYYHLVCGREFPGCI